jgi:fibronectin-binding autotransporter adhesin
MRTTRPFHRHSFFTVALALAMPVLSLPPNLHAASVKFTSSGTFTPPAGITSVTVECWGGGGAGGGAQRTFANSGGGGGGGGAYAKKLNIPVTPGTPYTVTIPTAATCPASGWMNGQTYDSAPVTFTGDSGVSLTANGGTGGACAINTTGLGGNGGAEGVGFDVVWKGGDGKNNATSHAGAGGAGASDTAAGNNAIAGTSTPGGTTVGSDVDHNGGAGATGKTGAGAGNTNNAAPGGGGGGGKVVTNPGSQPGSPGKQGQIIISYSGAAVAKADNSDNLNLGSSWMGGNPPDSAGIAKWDSTVLAANTTNLDADLTWGGITIANPGGLVTINAGNTLTNNGGIDMSSATADLALNCGLALGGPAIWNVAASRTLTLGGIVSGSFNITEQGSGKVVLSAANTYSGATAITGGTLQLGASGVIPDGSGKGDVSVTATSILDLNSYSETINGLSGAGIVDNAAASTASTLTVGAGDVSSAFSGVIQNSGSSSTTNLIKTGSGTLTLYGVNTFTGSVTVNGGNLTLGNANPLGNISGVTIGGATLGYNVNNAAISAPITLAGNVTVKVQNSVALLMSLNGGIGGTGNMTFATGDNTLSGDNKVSLGAASSFAGDVTITTTSVTPLNNMTVRLGTVNALPTTAVVTLDGGNGDGISRCDLDLFGFDQTLAGLTNIKRTSRLQRVYNSSGTVSTLTINNTADYSFGGTLGRSGANNFGLTKRGSGILTLTGANTYSGDTTVVQGTLKLTNANPNNDAAAVTIAATGATLELDFAGTDVVGSFYIGDMKQESGVWGAIGSGSQHETALITGTGRIQFWSPAIALALGGNPENIHTGSAVVNLLIGNTAASGSMALNYTLGGVAGSGTRDAGDSGAVAPITGTYTAVPGMNSFNITASDGNASNSPQSVAFSQTAYQLATANPVNGDIGNYHVGTARALGIQNTAPAGSYSEDLAATLAAGSNTTVSGAVAKLTAGGSDSSSLLVTLGGSGPQTGQATLDFTSTGMVGGVTISGLGATSLATQPVSISGTGYHLAAAAPSQTVELGALHVGTAKTAPLTLANTATADATYSETLQSSGFSNISANFTAAGSVSGIAGGGSGSGTLVVGVNAGAGVGEHTGTAILALQSAAVNGSGLGTTELASQAITIRAAGYELAATSFNATQVTLAPIHAGGTFAPQILSINNTLAAGTYHESLGAQFGNAAGVTTRGGPVTVTAGAAANTSLSVSLAGIDPGMHSGTVELQFDSREVNGSGLGTTLLPALGRTLTVNGEVFNGSGVWTLTAGAGGSWGTVENWTDANGIHAAPGTFTGYDKTDTATFTGTGTAATVTLDGTAPSLKTLVLSGATAYTIAQGTGGSALVFKSDTATASLTATGAGHILSTPVTLASNLTITVPNGGDCLGISGAISDVGGGRGLTKAGSGTLALDAANTYTGTTTVRDGTLVITSPCLSDTATLTVGAATASPAILHLPNAGTDLVGALVIDGVNQPAGIYDATNSSGSITGVGKILVAPYASFLSVIANPADRDPGDDPDADGIANVVEFVIGGNPASASDCALLPTVEVVTTDVGNGIPTAYLKFTYRRTATSLYMAPTVEYDADLAGSWITAANGATGIVVVTTANGYAAGVDRVEVYLPKSLAATGELFARLRVTAVP